MTIIKNKRNNINRFNKIIYFDEDSATDLIYMSNQGALREEFTKENSSSVKGGLVSEGSVGTVGILKSILGGKFSLSVSGSAGASHENLLNRVINNTVLTDYLKLDLDEFNIKVFDMAKVYPYENSLTYIKLMTPYMLMTEGKINFGEISVDVSKIDKTLELSKGYYEMILDDKEGKSILRFNLNAFKNSYLLPDLVKMNLTYHAVEVGQIELENLDIKKEFSSRKTSETPDAFTKALKDSGQSISEEKSSLIKVYDVILAGVKND